MLIAPVPSCTSDMERAIGVLGEFGLLRGAPVILLALIAVALVEMREN